jgi:tetratricopeptide (TPR) repeat protein
LEICLQVANDAAAARKTDLQEKALRTAVKIAFDQPRAHIELGRFLLDRKKGEAAFKSFKQAILLDRNSAPAHLGMAQAAVLIGEYDAAVVGLKDAVKIDPQNADALWSLAALYDQQLNVPAAALSAYRDFERLFPSDPRIVTARERIQKLATPSRAAPPPSERAAAAPARRIQYKKPAVRNTRDAVSAFNRGDEYLQQKNWDQAIHYYIRAIENDDLFSSAFFNLGIAYSIKGDYDLAKDAYLRALALQPNLVNARYNLALIYRETKDTVPALHMLREVIRTNPDHAQAHYALGLLYAEEPGTVALAKQHYQHFLELAPNDPAARTVRQWISTH